MSLERHIEAVIANVLNQMSDSLKEAEVSPSIEDVKAEVHNKVAYELEAGGLHEFVECAIARSQNKECESDYVLEELEKAECACTAM